MRSFYSILSLIFIAGMLANCGKSGCTDPDSKNYDPAAKSDNGTCIYEGSIVFYYGDRTTDSLLSNEYHSLTYYVDGEIIGSSASNVYYKLAPECNANGTVTYTKDLGSSYSKMIHYKVVDEDNNIIWEKDTEIAANTCKKLELVWVAVEK